MPSQPDLPPFVRDHTILRGVVGSRALGLAVEGTDDRDELGICVEPPEMVVGLRSFEQFSFRTQPQGVRSGPGDMDLVVFGLGKWCRLALRGNPAVLLVLFVPEPDLVVCTPEGAALREMGPAFVSAQSRDAFLGYMRQQRVRMEETSAGKRVNRPELVERFGFDTKFAYHLLRLGMQGQEYLATGRMTLPMPEGARRELLAVRRGEVSEVEVLHRAAELEGGIERIGGLPPDGDEAAVERFMIETYRRRWGW